MRRAILIVIIIIAVAVIAVGVAYTFSSASRQVASGGAIFSGATGGNVGAVPANIGADTITPFSANGIPPGDTINIGTPQGIVTVNNFYKTAVGTDGSALILERTSSYEIVYNASGGSAFGIYVMAEPVTVNEAAAEQELTSILGVSQTDACKLNASWSVSPSVDPSRVGKSYNLTFCIGS